MPTPTLEELSAEVERISVIQSVAALSNQGRLNIISLALNPSVAFHVIVEGQQNKSTHDIVSKFKELTREWKKAKRGISSTTEIVMQPAYQQIIGLGEPAIPLILHELQQEVDHWFWALIALSGENPVPAAMQGRMKKMAEIWLNWGREKGYIR